MTLGAGTVNVQSGTNYLQGPTTSSANFNISSTLNVTGVITNTGTGDVKVNDTGTLNVCGTLGAVNFLMSKNAQLIVTIGGLSLTGDFSFQQTDPSKWTYNGTSGLGPDLKIPGTGGIQTLEVGGVINGGLTNNFGLNSLTLGTGATVKLLDLVQNAKTSGWTSGSEVLYVGALYSGGDPPTLDLNNISCYVWNNGVFDRLYVGESYHGINVIDSAVPVPPTLLLLGSGLLGLVGLRKFRKC